MNDEYTITEIDVSTGKITTRKMTPDEIAKLQQENAQRLPSFPDLDK